ncbi:hypothetical protein CYY_002954 [Polysphondylium violaceum]|uniref:Uncharacterized protein n=1 Tax=Polysphondylium violaceum TaxID=133409 RepID=A0A8J4PZ79_9MYCE|nr:hypothetical protein CYY_002954 [Polysphondylium violaceum]
MERVSDDDNSNTNSNRLENEKQGSSYDDSSRDTIEYLKQNIDIMKQQNNKILDQLKQEIKDIKQLQDKSILIEKELQHHNNDSVSHQIKQDDEKEKDLYFHDTELLNKNFKNMLDIINTSIGNMKQQEQQDHRIEANEYGGGKLLNKDFSRIMNSINDTIRNIKNIQQEDHNRIENDLQEIRNTIETIENDQQQQHQGET